MIAYLIQNVRTGRPAVDGLFPGKLSVYLDRAKADQHVMAVNDAAGREVLRAAAVTIQIPGEVKLDRDFYSLEA